MFLQANKQVYDLCYDIRKMVSVLRKLKTEPQEYKDIEQIDAMGEFLKVISLSASTMIQQFNEFCPLEYEIHESEEKSKIDNEIAEAKSKLGEYVQMMALYNDEFESVKQSITIGRELLASADPKISQTANLITSQNKKLTDEIQELKLQNLNLTNDLKAKDIKTTELIIKNHKLAVYIKERKNSVHSEYIQSRRYRNSALGRLGQGSMGQYSNNYNPNGPGNSNRNPTSSERETLDNMNLLDIYKPFDTCTKPDPPSNNTVNYTDSDVKEWLDKNNNGMDSDEGGNDATSNWNIPSYDQDSRYKTLPTKNNEIYDQSGNDHYDNELFSNGFEPYESNDITVGHCWDHEWVIPVLENTKAIWAQGFVPNNELCTEGMDRIINSAKIFKQDKTKFIIGSTVTKFIQSLEDVDVDEMVSCMKKYYNDNSEAIEAAHRLIIPLCFAQHWVVVIIKTRNWLAVVKDSIDTGVSRITGARLDRLEIFMNIVGVFRIPILLKAPQQLAGSHDCGYHAVLNMVNEFHKVSNSDYYNINNIRKNCYEIAKNASSLDL